MTADAGRAAAPLRHVISPWLVGFIDLVLVLVFVWLGRITHDSGGFTGYLGAAYPFVIALTAAWVLLLWLTLHPPTDIWPAGLGIWFVTAAGGLGIRLFGGGTVTGGFPWVTFGVLFAFLIGWRLIFWLARRRTG